MTRTIRTHAPHSHKRSSRKTHNATRALVARLHSLDSLSTTQAALLQDAYATLATTPLIQSPIRETPRPTHNNH